MIRVLICDDHPIFREGVRMIVKQSKDIALVEEAESSQDLRDKLRHATYDVIILDISLPGGSDGLDLLRELRQEYPKMAVLMLSMHSEEQFAVRALKAGAAGYLVKGSVPAELLSAIRKVAAGGKHISPALAEQLAFELEGRKEKAPHDVLSDREYRVMRSLASGKGLTETAQELCLSTSTVATYRSRILSKLGLRNTAELIRYAVTHRLID
jgi:two-component system, NarL family, invasion response regulator UvrY